MVVAKWCCQRTMLRAISASFGEVNGLSYCYLCRAISAIFGVGIGPFKPYAHTITQGNWACIEAAKDLTNGCTALF
jgi:hypothetical protein